MARPVLFRAALLLVLFSWPLGGEAQRPDAAGRAELPFKQLIHIPGPNPILVPGTAGAWDDGVIEAADAFEDLGVYYLYYHGSGQGKGYRLGVATAPHPLGPFRKHGQRPVLDLGPKGAWDDRGVACAMVLKEGQEKYWMWYSGCGEAEGQRKWSIGLATASAPVGPWKKHPGNPILRDFGYVGGVVKGEGTYYLYTAHPIGSTGPDYSRFCLATADHPAGPWEPRGRPVLREGTPGEWDDGGFSEAEVVQCPGILHTFYGGAKLFPERIRSRESIGYAYGFDRYHFVKHGRNPVVPREACPNTAAMSEVHAIFEMPFVYLYHTLRYVEPPRPADREKFPSVEHLGVQVLATATPFRLEMPVLSLETLAPGKTTSPADVPPIGLSQVREVALTAECVYTAKAATPLRLHVRSSYDGLRYDTADLHCLENDFKPGAPCRKTFPLDARVRFLKVLVENADPSESVSKVKITATLGG